jgi:hypothetical protein
MGLSYFRKTLIDDNDCSVFEWLNTWLLSCGLDTLLEETKCLELLCRLKVECLLTVSKPEPDPDMIKD